ncbi:MAG: ABC transporter permease [Oscillospiraceae bacterium]|nr:ABC transporter permease [Oscillospiraceae bacterium]
MGIWENIILAIAGIRANRMRSLLTMLGIIIGISAVITISTLGSIMTASVKGTFNEIGGTRLVAFGSVEKEHAARSMYDDDYLSVEMVEDVKDEFKDEIKGVSFLTGNTTGRVIIRNEEKNVQLYGVNSGYIITSQTPLMAGRYISDTDCEKMRDICVISDRQAKKMFGSERDALGKKLDITVEVEKKNYLNTYTVVGVYRYKLTAIQQMLYSAMDVNADDWNSEIYVPYSTYARAMNKKNETFFSFNVMLYDDVETNAFCDRVKDYMNNKYYRDNNAAEVISQTAESQMGMINQLLGTVSLVISIIAGISLLVGGIGVMNIMLVSVTERTREIGVRKALGAPNSAIRMQFIIESMIICLIGGLIGIGLGLLMGNIAGLVVGTHAIPSIPMIVFAVCFSMAIGVFFGYYPANRAAQLDPIEALRYE